MTVTTNEIQIFNNPAFGQVRTLEIEGIPFFVGKDVALALGYVKPTNAISQHVDNEDSLKQGIPDNQGFMQETTLINESGLYSLVFGSKLSTAKAFKRWITHDVLPTLRKTGSYHIKKAPVRRKRTPALTTKVKASLLWVEGVSKCLNLNESSKLALLKEVGVPLGLPVPNYTPSQDTMKSATELLRENNYGMNARVFNRKLIEKGLMEEVTRDSSKGKKKRFKSLTPVGLEYGENQVHPSNPHETQPLYYVHKFNELVDIVCKD